jgi:hypothetical protein
MQFMAQTFSAVSGSQSPLALLLLNNLLLGRYLI